MHYANGRAAKVGDLVRGKGYNIKHEIIGILVAANPAGTACNCTVSCVAIGPYGTSLKRPVLLTGNDGIVENPQCALEAVPTAEYGQLDAFVALDPKTGEVLLPEPEPAA